jgi:hypothetical protein
MAVRKRGLYVSYNENTSGLFGDAVAISNDLGCVTWFDGSPLDPTNLECPTEIIIRITGAEKYYRGILLAVRRADSLPADFAAGERNHRPEAWRQRDREGQGFKSVLFINGLREVEPPPEVVNRHPPQHPEYIDLG